jgi:hypothetical protein
MLIYYTWKPYAKWPWMLKLGRAGRRIRRKRSFPLQQDQSFFVMMLNIQGPGS